MSLAPDTTVNGRYTLQQRIAVGGMGEVWRAQDEVLGRAVAVKVLKEEYAADPSFLSRFRNEARHAAGLSHPGIANVFDYGEVGDTAYLVMELVNGEPLSTLLARDGRLPPETALDIVGQAGLALQAAHEGGLVHRDVKPGNLMIRPDGVVKVTDFGIARAVDAAPVTQTGLVVGTAAYLSPEQASGREITPASDVYSLGVVAYECLAGERPFQADSAIGVAMAHATSAPPSLGKDVPPLVADFVMRALEKDPARRQPGAGDFGRTALALAASLREPGGDTRLLTTPFPAEPTAPTPTARMPSAPAPAPVPAGAAADDERQRRRVRNIFVAVGAAVVLLGFLLLRACTGPAYARVPTLVGHSYAQAAGALDSVGLDVARRVVHDPAHRRGVVLRQSQPPGTRLAEGTTVTLTVASGARLVTVDAASLVGRPLGEVQRALQDLGLNPRVVAAPSKAAAGTVTKVDPSGGLREGSTVTVTVAAEPAPPKQHGKHGHGDHGD